MAIAITDLLPDDATVLRQTAQLLVDGFRDNWPDAWPDMESALEDVHQSLGGDRISRIAVESNTKPTEVVGWIGGIRQYDGRVWELHPLVVKSSHQNKGIGRALVDDLEAQVRDRGCITLWVGTDDETGMTSLSGVNLYDDVLGHIARIQNFRRHPYEFYQSVGFTIVGVIPDANGMGKPDILMAKRV